MSSFAPTNVRNSMVGITINNQPSGSDVVDAAAANYNVESEGGGSGGSAARVSGPSASLLVHTEPTPINKRKLSNSGKPLSERIAEAIARVKSTTPASHGGKRQHEHTEPTSDHEPKKPKHDSFSETQQEAIQMPYQSIICINMPPRIGFVADQPIPEPDPQNLPFGDTEDYYNSMIIHYLDEMTLTYTKATELYLKKFPSESITDEAIRKRHIRSLLRLSKKYGLKKPDQIGSVSLVIKRRGHSRARRLDTIQPDATHSGISVTSPGHTVANHPAPAAEIPTASEQTALSNNIWTPSFQASERDFEKACIVVWHDAEKMSFREIRSKLEDEYNWSIGLGTIEKHYYASVMRVHGPGGKKAKKAWAHAHAQKGQDGILEAEFPTKRVDRCMSI